MKKGLVVISVATLLFSFAYAQQEDILKLKEKIIDIQNRGDLGFKNFTFCSNILGFASYVPLAKPVIDQKGQLLVYYEPLNIFTSKRENIYEIWYTQDMVLMKDNNEILSEWKEILNFHYMAKSPVLDIFAQNSINLEGKLPSGKYKFKAILKDKLSGKTAAKTVNFEIK